MVNDDDVYGLREKPTNNWFHIGLPLLTLIRNVHSHTLSYDVSVKWVE